MLRIACRAVGAVDAPQADASAGRFPMPVTSRCSQAGRRPTSIPWGHPAVWKRHRAWPIYTPSAWRCESYGAVFVDKSPTVNGLHVRLGIRQSMPPSSMANCAGVTDIFPSAGEGHTKQPFSRRLENRHAPWPSNQITLIKSPRLPRNTNRCPENGSSAKTFSARAERPLSAMLCIACRARVEPLAHLWTPP